MVSKAKNVSTEQKANIGKPANVKPAKPSELYTKAKVLPASVEMTLKTPAGSLSSEGAGTKDIKVSSRSTASENQPDIEPSMPKEEESEQKIQEFVVVPETTAKVVETVSATATELMRQVELAKVDVVAKGTKKAEPMELGETKSEAEEPMDIESCPRDKVENLTCSESKSSTSTTEIRPDVSQPKQFTVPPKSTEAVPTPEDTNTQSPQSAIELPETFLKASLQVQQTTLAEPQSTAQGLKAKINSSQTPAGSSSEAALEAELPVKEQETKTVQKGMLMTI